MKKARLVGLYCKKSILFSHSLAGIIGCFQNRGCPKMDGLQWTNPIKMDDLGMETSIYSFPMFHPPLPMRPDSRFCRRCGTARPDPFLPAGDSQGNLRGTEWTPKLTTSNGIPQKSGILFFVFFPITRKSQECRVFERCFI